MSDDAPGALSPAALARVRRLEQIERLSGESRLYDSRIEIWCARCGMDPALARRWLHEGHAVEFSSTVTGERYHVIRPGELI